MLLPHYNITQKRNRGSYRHAGSPLVPATLMSATVNAAGTEDISEGLVHLRALQSVPLPGCAALCGVGK